MGRAPSVLSIVSDTSARPSGWRPVVPAKITSSILPPRSDFAPCSPITQARASTTLDLPEPLGPTTQVMPGSKRSVVADAKDLKPRSVRLLRCTRELSLRSPRPPVSGDCIRSGPGSGFTARCKGHLCGNDLRDSGRQPGEAMTKGRHGGVPCTISAVGSGPPDQRRSGDGRLPLVHVDAAK